MKIGDYIRNVTLFGWAVFLLLVAAVCNLGLVFVNYFATEQSFELLGFEPRKVAQDALLGFVFDACWPKATVAHLLAAGLAVAMFFGVFGVIYFATRALHLVLEARQASAAGDTLQRDAAYGYMYFEIARSVITLLPLILVARLDLALYRYRWAAQLQGADTASVAVDSVKDWSLGLTAHHGLMAWSAGSLAPWAYLGITACFAIFLEFRSRRLSEAWAQLWSPAGEVPAAPAPVPEPVPEVPGLERPVGPGPEAPAPPVQPIPPAPRPENEPAVEVIGGPDGLRVTLAEALANPRRYWVDPETRQVWDAEFHRTLTGQESFREA